MVRSLVFKNEWNGPWVVRPITYIVELIYSPLLWLANCLTDLSKYTPSNLSTVGTDVWFVPFIWKEFSFCSKFIGVNLSVHHAFISSVTKNKQDWIIFDLDWKWPYWLVILETVFQGQGQMCRIVWPLLWTMERLSTLEKANCNNAWSINWTYSVSEWVTEKLVNFW